MPASTIFAWASAAGRAGVAVLRISGPDTLRALAALGIETTPVPRQASLRRLVHPTTHEPIDEALLLHFPAPHSFTGETVLELHTHGSLAVIRCLTELLSALPGFRLAEPGEFARRAYLNGKFDLIEAEGLADLIDAETEAQRRQALNQMQGHLSEHYTRLRGRILHAMAMMEAYIDFPDEEIPPHVTAEAADTVNALQQDIRAILDDRGIGEKIRSGLHVTILGAPNVGKSSLLNTLARRDAAIVSPQAGTTRDLIEIELDLRGYRLTLTDTAGLRETNNAIESEGIKRALARSEVADITLAMFDASTLPSLDETTLATLDSRSILLLNKIDALPASVPLPDTIAGQPFIPLSIARNSGLDQLVAILSDRIQSSLHSTQHPLITQTRHRLALQAAQHHLERFTRTQELELATEELRLAAQAIAKITGKIAVDELLDVVFGRFCIGK